MKRMLLNNIINDNDGSSAISDNQKLKKYATILRKEYLLNRKILFIQVPQFQFNSFNLDIAKNKCCYVFPPTGIQSIVKSIENRNLDVNILDLNYEFLKKVICDKTFNYYNWLSILDEYLEKYDPSVIGTTCINVSKLFADDNPFTMLLKHLHKRKKYIVIAGGATIMNGVEEFLNRDLCHFIMDRESENKVNFLFDVLYDESNNFQPTSEIYFKLNGKIEETNGPLDKVELKGNLNKTYELIPIEDYHNVGVLNHYSRLAGEYKPFATIQLGRGCRMNCMFCGVPKFTGRGVRQYTVKDLLEEITYLIKERGIRHFEWLDDDLLANRETIKEALKELVKLRQQYGITWAANNGLIAAFITDELLELMRDSGCVGFKIGIETGNPDMMRRIRKPATVEKIIESCKMINKFPEMFVGGNYILGLFGEETFGQMLDTLKLSCQVNLDWSSFSVFQFTSTPAVVKEKLRQIDTGLTAVTPARNRPDGQIIEEEGVVSGLEVFNIPKDVVPSPSQCRQIWLTFNLIGNYINNKNLRTGGSPEKFISWTKILQITYPYNCYMPLFTALAHMLLGNKKLAEKHYKQTLNNLSRNKYWIHRFEQFEFMDIIENFPNNPSEVHEVLDSLRVRYSKWIK